MSKFELIKGSCLEQEVDCIVNAANRYLQSGGGICGAIFASAGYIELTEACKEYKVPLNDGDAVITKAYNIPNTNYIIHAVGPNFYKTPEAFPELYKAYYNSLLVLKDNNLHSIAFPLISSGIFGGNLENPVSISCEQAIKAYKKFTKEFPDYNIEVKLCCYSEKEYEKANDFIKTISII